MREHKYEWDVLYLKCPCCERWLSASCFYTCKSTYFWVASACIDCSKEKRKNFYHNNIEKEKERGREYRLANEEKERERHRQFRLTHRDKRNNQNKKRAKENTDRLWFNRGSFHDKANRYVRKYWLRPNKCSICWKEWNILMHHPYTYSYDKWNKVVFCCASCHCLIHSWSIKCPNPVDLLEMNRDV